MKQSKSSFDDLGLSQGSSPVMDSLTGNNKKKRRREISAPATGIFKKIFFIELILVFSFISSYLILMLLPGKEEKKEPFIRQHYLIKNFKILNFFLNLDLEKWADLTEAEAAGIDNPLIRNIFLLKTAGTLLEGKKPPDIPALLNHIETKYEFITFRKRELILRYYYEKKNYPGFISYFDANTPGSAKRTGFETELRLLNCLLKTGDQTRAFNIFRELFKKNNLQSFTKWISRKELTDLLKQLTYDDWYQKFYFLVEQNRYREFRSEKQYIAAPTLTGMIDAEFYYRRGEYALALKSLQKIDSSRLLNHKKKLIAKMKLRRDEYDNIMEEVDELKNDEEIYARLLLDCAGILLMRGQPGMAADFFEKYIALNIPHGPDFYRILWVTAWLHYRNNNKEKAIRYFRIGCDSKFSSYKIANNYWLHRLTGEGAVEITNHPFSYYYVRITGAEKNRGQVKSKNFIHFINGKQGSRLAGIIADIKLLLKFNLVDECFAFIEWAKRDKQLLTADRNLLKLIESIIYLKKQNFHAAFVRFRKNFPDYTIIVPPASLSAIYAPVRYKGLIDKYAKIFDIDTLLLLALIREETMFKADAMSEANANGLMQLLLSTAQEMARGEGIKIKKWDLYNPEINIRLGSRYFRYLLDKYDGQVHLALAAYNAGDHRVDQWLQEFGFVETDEFIEMIPFSETRNYVKNIIRNHYYYEYYYK